MKEQKRLIALAQQPLLKAKRMEVMFLIAMNPVEYSQPSFHHQEGKVLQTTHHHSQCSNLKPINSMNKPNNRKNQNDYFIS